MFVVPRKDGPYTLFCSDGRVAVYANKAQMVRATGWYRLRNTLVNVEPDSVEQWLKAVNEPAEFRTESVSRIVLDGYGRPLSMADFAKLEPRSNQPQRESGRRWRKSRCMRYPKTYAERRMNSVVFEDDGEVPARGARTGKNLADDRDDKKLVLQRNWKAFRRTQWRAD
jgi:hypothetical protein